MPQRIGELHLGRPRGKCRVDGERLTQTRWRARAPTIVIRQHAVAGHHRQRLITFENGRLVCDAAAMPHVIVVAEHHDVVAQRARMRRALHEVVRGASECIASNGA